MLEILIGFIDGAMVAGRLRQADARVAAQHLRGLLQSEVLDIFQFQTGESIDAERIKGAVERAVEVFMRAYGPNTAG